MACLNLARILSAVLVVSWQKEYVKMGKGSEKCNKDDEKDVMNNDWVGYVWKHYEKGTSG